MGPKEVYNEGRGYTRSKEGMLLTKNDAYDFFGGFQGKELADLRTRMVYGGLIGEDDGYLEMKGKWKKLVDASYDLTRIGQKVSPLDILNSYLGKGPLGSKKDEQSVWQTQYRSGRKFLVNTQTGEVKYQGPRFETTYQRNLDLTDPVTAKAIATSMFQQLMHRDPGKGEMAGFSDALRAAEQSSPVVTETTTEYDKSTGEPVGTTSTSQGGLSADGKQYLAEQRIKKSKEYGATQAATTFSNALENAIFNNPYGSL